MVVSLYVYYFSQLLQEDLVELDHGHPASDKANIKEEVQSIIEPAMAYVSAQANMGKSQNEMVSEATDESVQLLGACMYIISHNCFRRT